MQMLTLKTHLHKLWSKFSEMYGSSMLKFWAWFILAIVLVGIGLVSFFNTAAPSTITMASGEKGSIYHRYAMRYQEFLAKQGVKVVIVPSDGSSDNLRKLTDKSLKVDVGFVQSGIAKDKNIEGLQSLGSVAYQPIMLFYRGANKRLISEFKGMRLDIGEPGSGTHALALSILKENGITPEDATTQLIAAPSLDPVQDLLTGKFDAIFVMGDSVSVQLIRSLIKAPGINIFNFEQADGYTKRIKFLHKLVLPKGAIDLGKNIPINDLNLIAPSVELIAKDTLHPALSDLLLDAAQEIHSSSSLFVKSGEFPNLNTQEYHLSTDASRYYKSGKVFLYREFPFWVASLINRVLVVLIPLLIILIPAIKIAPSIYRWKIQLRIYPFYKTLLELERDAFSATLTTKHREEILTQLDTLEVKLNKIKVPAAFADMFYGLRLHINFVRGRLLAETTI